jgi:4-hydroxybenzoate polyprenyltransferase
MDVFSKLRSIVRLLRPQQWAKNLFVFLPAFFDGRIGHGGILLSSMIAAITFSLVASAVYCFNDIWDVEADKLHPKKCVRPIASGKISVKTGYIAMSFCLLATLAALSFFEREKGLILASLIVFYFLMNIAYCMKLKQYTIVDIILISTGFVLRILVGGIAAGISLSAWIILMVFLLAMFLAFAKRRDDVILYQTTHVLPRRNTERYNLDFMNQVITLTATIIMVAYIMYTLSPDVMERFHCQYVYVTSIFVLAGIIRYLQVTIVDAQSGSPTKVLMHDRFLQSCVLGWILAFVVILYVFPLNSLGG